MATDLPATPNERNTLRTLEGLTYDIGMSTDLERLEKLEKDCFLEIYRSKPYLSLDKRGRKRRKTLMKLFIPIKAQVMRLRDLKRNDEKANPDRRHRRSRRKWEKKLGI